MGKVLVTDTYLSDIADAIRSKNSGTTQYKPSEMADAIAAISTSDGGSEITLQDKTAAPSESSQTITPDSGYDGLSSVTVEAISSSYIGSGVTQKAAATYTPSTSDQTIAAGQYLSGAQTIQGDANLTADNIKSGTSIFGVTGTYEGSGGSNTDGLKYTTGEFAGNDSMNGITIVHGLGEVPKLFAVFADDDLVGTQTTGAFATMMLNTGISTRYTSTTSLTFAQSNTVFYGTEEPYLLLSTPSGSAYCMASIDESSITLNRLSSTGYFLSGTTYRWIAIADWR